MPSKDYLPSADQALLGYAVNYSSIISADPLAVGLTTPIADTLSNLVVTYQMKLAALASPSIRNPIAIREKDRVKADLAFYLRRTARQIQGSMTVTDTQRAELRLKIRRGRHAPAHLSTVPALRVISVVGHNIRIRVRDASGAVRGRVAGADGALIYSFVGDTPPAGTEGWTCEGPTVHESVIVAFDSAIAVGAKVWLTAQWFNTRGTSPGCTPVAVVIGAEGALAA